MLRLSAIVLLLLITISSSAVFGQSIGRTELRSGWMIQSSAKVHSDGHEVSSGNMDTSNWYPTKVPATVLAALVKNGIYKNIFFGKNFEKIPTKPFEVPWWYRTTFTLQKLSPDQTIRLQFNGINYRADVWLNGKKIASSDTMMGGFRRFGLDVSKEVNNGTNILALKVAAPKPGDPTLGFVDWNPMPPDHDMGIWRNVWLEVTNAVSIDHPFVKTKVDTVTLKHADITITADINNHSSRSVSGILKGEIGGIHFEQHVSLRGNETKNISFEPDKYPQLGIDHPILWWTHDLGDPHLYTLKLTFEADNKLSDQKEIRFGIRSVSDYINKQGFRGYKLNGKKILVKGGGWTDPMLLNAKPAYEQAEIQYAVHMGLNAIRMEGFWGHNQHIYNLCDKSGILIMVGYSAQWEWKGVFGAPADEYGGIKGPEKMMIAEKSFRDQILWLRNHPSIFLWAYGSDKLPRPILEKKYQEILKDYDPTRPFIASAKEHTSQITGPTAVKMRGPYDYVPPDYWYVDTQYGGAFGFNTETSPGPEIPVLESLKKMIPADSLWPINDIWLYHAARGNFHNFTRYNNAMDHRLGKPTGLSDYLRKAQYLNYEGMRAMYEAFEANRFKSTGIIQWMYNSSWPKLWWQLFDYYLMPTGAFYGAQKANEPVHISYNYGLNGIDIINNTAHDTGQLTANISVLNFDLNPSMVKSIPVSSVKANSTDPILSLPDEMRLSKTYFLDLKLRDERNEVVSSNFYVLSTQHDVLEPDSSTWFFTPEKQYADLTQLNDLKRIRITHQERFEKDADQTIVHVALKNETNELAFMVHLDLRKATSGASVVPVFWGDNYISLLPGEERVITGYCNTSDLDGEKPKVTITGWNVEQ